MAIKIVTRTLGKILKQDAGYLVKIRGQEPKTFSAKKDADAHLEKQGPKRYDVGLWVNKKLTWKAFKRKKDAEDYLHRRNIDINDGTYRELKKATFSQFMEEWKSTYLIPGTIDAEGNLEKKRLKPSTIKGYRTIIDCYLLPAFEHVPLQAIAPADIIALESRLLQREKFSNKSAHNVLTLLGRILVDARRGGYLKISPMMDIEKTKFTCKKGRALRPEEAQQLVAACEGDIKAIVLIMLLAGLRRGEVLALRWTDIDFDGDVIHACRSVEWLSRKHGDITAKQNTFVFQPPKYHSIRNVDMSPLLKKELREKRLRSKDKEGLVFQTDVGTPLYPSNVYQRDFLPAVQQAEIGKLTFHDLRHTFGSWKIEQGENVLYVSKQMGHKDAAITLKVYSHLIKECRPEAAAKTDVMLTPKPTLAKQQPSGTT